VGFLELGGRQAKRRERAYRPKVEGCVVVLKRRGLTNGGRHAR
jgi:hypothetical protein